MLQGILALAILTISGGFASAQVFPPGTFSIDGYPVVCGSNIVILNPSMNDIGLNTGNGQIYLNPILLGGVPTVVKLYVFGHECAHSLVGPNETAADCWSVRVGRQQGWFPPQAFALLMQAFQGNPGDVVHPSGPKRVADMLQCYNSP